MLGDVDWAGRYVGVEIPTVRQLLVAIARHRSMVLYAVVTVLALIVTMRHARAPFHLIEASLITIVAYSVAEYCLHRHVLHARLLWRSRLTAGIWRRLHYDHHMDPKDMTVLFAHPAASVPFLMLLSALAAIAAGDMDVFPAMVGTSFLAFMYYEAVHAAAHMLFPTDNGWLARRCRHHLRHHYMDEAAHFGVGSGVLDRILARLGRRAAGRGPSVTARNLGYDRAMALRYPWVAAGYARKRAALQGRAIVRASVAPIS
ncbi:MAG TPA: sterol desaturase family protein [Reyranella sp.]|nr:sterol desaturase family protein [Reyranella sp.]